MDLKNLMSHAVRPVNPTTTVELPAQNELVQLSEEDLQQIIGGCCCCCCCSGGNSSGGNSSGGKGEKTTLDKIIDIAKLIIVLF